MHTKLTSRTVVITGATSGIGFQAALDFAREGAFVIGTGRFKERSEEAILRIKQQVPGANIQFALADLSSQGQVHKMASEIRKLLIEKKGGQLDILINNAGGTVDHKTMTEDGIEKTFAVNHLAPFLLTHLLLPIMDMRGRVLTVSSNSHYHTRFNPRTAPNPPFYFILWAYKVSKLANVLFSVEFNRRKPQSFPLALAVDPGLVNTDIGLKGNGWLVQKVWRHRQTRGTAADVPVRTLLHLAEMESDPDAADIYWKDCQPKASSPVVWDRRLGRDLWEESCRLCHIDEYFPAHKADHSVV